MSSNQSNTRKSNSKRRRFGLHRLGFGRKRSSEPRDFDNLKTGSRVGRFLATCLRILASPVTVPAKWMGRRLRRRQSRLELTQTRGTTQRRWWQRLLLRRDALRLRDRRQWKHLLFACPAILIATAGMVVLFARGREDENRKILDKYLRRGEMDLREGNAESALLWYERALSLSDDDPRVALAHATAVLKKGDVYSALRQFDELARRGDVTSSAQASLQAAALLLQNPDKFADGQIDLPPVVLAEDYLRASLRRTSNDRQTVEALAQLLAATERSPEAIEILEKATFKSPELLILATEYAHRAGMSEKSISLAGRSVTILQPRLSAEPDNVALRSLVATMQQRNGDFVAASQTLSDGIRRTDGKNREPLTNAYVSIAMAEFDKIQNAVPDSEGVARQLTLLQNMLKFAAGDLAVNMRLCQFVALHEDKGQRFESFLQEALAATDSAGPLHLILGTFYADTGNLEKALFHLQAAQSHGAPSPILMNNLAWVMSAIRPDELDSALGLVNAALEFSPDDPNYLSTRGQVYFKQKNWEAALRDLESSVNRLPENAEVREMLATTYDKLGNPEIAARHRKRIPQPPSKPE